VVSAPGRDATSDEVNEEFADAVHDKSYRGVIEDTERPLVSHDIVGNPASCVFSARDTMVSGRVVKVLGWYDNERGYANRRVDLVELMAMEQTPC
jgi:glyceraldehyde 3-phosphate dehydrogenase (phosphorylating)